MSCQQLVLEQPRSAASGRFESTFGGKRAQGADRTFLTPASAELRQTPGLQSEANGVTHSCSAPGWKLGLFEPAAKAVKTEPSVTRLLHCTLALCLTPCSQLQVASFSTLQSSLEVVDQRCVAVEYKRCVWQLQTCASPMKWCKAFVQDDSTS